MNTHIFTITLLISLFSSSLFAQVKTSEKWFSSDGTNELLLLLEEDFALYEGRFWDVESKNGNALVLDLKGEKRKLVIENTSEGFVLKDDKKAVRIQKSKSDDIKKRKVVETDLSDVFLVNGQVVLSGLFQPEGNMPNTVSIIYNHAFSEIQRKFVADIDEKGRFKMIFPLDYPQFIMVKAGGIMTSVFTKPGAKQAIVLNEQKNVEGINSWYVADPIEYMGDLAVVNEEQRVLNPEFLKIREYFENDSLQKVSDPETYQSYRMDLWKKHEDFYQSYFDSVPTSEFLKDYSIRDARLYAADDMRRYMWLNESNTRSNGVMAVPQAYTDNILELMPDELNDLMTSNYGSLNREFVMPRLPGEVEEVNSIFLELMVEELLSQDLEDEMKEFVTKWGNQEKLAETDEEAMEISKQLGELLNKDQALLTKTFIRSRWKRLKNKTMSFGQLRRSSMLSIFIDMNFIEKGIDVPESIIADLEDLDLHPFVKETIYEKIEVNESLKNEKFVEGVEIVSNSNNVLSQLKEKHLGKVVYIDLWATWCGPCISEFSYLESLKKNDLDDVEFVYLCAQSQRKAFEMMVKKYELKGENYFLTDEQFQELDKQVKISGFPTYLLITKEGKLVRNGIKRPSAGQNLVKQLQGFSAGDR